MRTNIKSDFTDKFFHIEEELFDLKSPEGVYYWDLFRHSVSTTVLYRLFSSNQSHSFFSCALFFRKIKKVKKLFDVLKSFPAIFNKYDNIVLATSRNFHSGMIIDQQVFAALMQLNKDNTLVVENFDEKSSESYPGFDYVRSFKLHRLFFISRYKKIDFSPLAARLNKYYDTDFFNHSYFNSLYRNFWKDYSFYKFIFKRMGIKRVYMTQNGIQKGLFKAAQEMDIEVYEFQHGLIDKTHMAYSYPRLESVEKKVYLPTHLLKLSDYWLQDCYLPLTKQVVLGNDYFVPAIDEKIIPDSKKILVISSPAHGEYLHKFLCKCFESNMDFTGYEFKFKLHPTEYNHVAYYERLFCTHPNVQVVTGEQSVTQWMAECSTMLLIQSTSAYEALQCGRKVAILKELSYEVMEPIFCEKNTHIVENPYEFMNCLELEAAPEKPNYFQKLDNQILQSITIN